jgi:hypothetical protein
MLDPTDPQSVTTAPSKPRKARMWIPVALSAVLLGPLALILTVVVGVLGPWLLDDARLDWTVRAVVLDWRDFGQSAAVARLQYELDHQGIGMQVGDEHCVFHTAEDASREVRCEWSAKVDVPYVGAVGVPFSSRARVDRHGRLW